MANENEQKALTAAWSDHSRLWKDNLWVYPVISRRANGLSLGINLNPDHHCSFSCAYCQSGIQENHKSLPIDIYKIELELREFLDFYKSSEFFNCDFFKDVPVKNKQLKDICLSGDGESTIVKEFAEVCKLMVQIQDEYQKDLGSFKLRLITNGSRLGSDSVNQGLHYLFKNDGEIWAKLDAGSEEWFKKINRSPIPFATILNNLKRQVQLTPLCIQTMLCNLQGEIPSGLEIQKYIENLAEIYNSGIQGKKNNLIEVQLYTVIRHTMLPDVLPLPKEFLENVAQKIKKNLPLQVRVF